MVSRTDLPYAWADVRGRLQREVRRLLPALGIHNQPDRQGLVTPLNPTRKDRHPGSFVIWTQGEGAGAWKDYATGEQGDVFDLIGYLARPQPDRRIDIYWWALDFLGLERKAIRCKAELDAERERHERERRAAEAREKALLAKRSRALKALWLSLPPIKDTPAERYLVKARSIPLDRLGQPPQALRWAEAVDWIDPETGEVTTWRHVMVAAMTLGQDVVALHRTYLAPDGSGKRGGAKDKTMIGPARGAAIRLSKGASGLSPGQAAKRGVTGPLALGEGIETCLPVAVARPDLRVWAAGSLSLMGCVEWPACASAVVLLRDNDWHSPEARAAFDRVEAHWRAQSRGRPVHVVASAVGGDFNDWMRSA